jgi:hypothetical protein
MDDVMTEISALDWQLQIKKDSFVFCVKRNFVLFYGYFIFSLHWNLVVEFKIYNSLNNTTISEYELCSAELFFIHI